MAISLTTLGAASTQDFDTLASTGTSGTALPAEWLFLETGTANDTTYGVGIGGANTGNTYSFGSLNASDRAFGILRSGTLVSRIGTSFVNDTGATLTSLAVSYTGEQWRLGTTARADRIDFQFSLTATSLADGAAGTWTDVDALDFSSPSTNIAGALDGNALGNRTAVSSTISGLNIPAGATFFIRWTDVDATGADDGLAVDDFSLTPIGAAALPTLSSGGDLGFNELNSGTRDFIFAFNLSAPAPAGGVTFDIATVDGTALAGSDYVARSLTGVTIPEGQSQYIFSVSVTTDLVVEPDETFSVVVTNVTGATLADGDAVGTIINDDVPDTTPPSVTSITRNDPATTDLQLVSYTVTFSEAVTGVDLNDFALTTTGVLGATIQGVSGSGTTYTVSVDSGVGDGTVRLDVVDDDSIIDGASNPLGGAGSVNGDFTGPVYTFDDTDPTLTASTPADNATAVAVGANIVLTFSEAVQAGTGNIVLRNTATSALITIPVTDAQVGFSGSTVTINPTADLATGTRYQVLVDATAIRDAAGNTFAGTAGDAFDFRTAGPRILNVPSEFADIGAANAAASPGDTILLGPGYGFTNGNLSVNDLTVTGDTSNERVTLIANFPATRLTLGGTAPFRINMSTGNVTLIGNAGDNIYISTDSGDTIVESANGGIDTAQVDTSASYTLPANIEILEGRGNGTQTLSGNGGDNTITHANFQGAMNAYGLGGNDTLIAFGGADLTDSLYGGTGDDVLYGFGGTDFLFGNENDDTLYGGAGSDGLYGDGFSGNQGTDTAVFTGNRADYTITTVSPGRVQVVDNRSGSPDGTDDLRDVEFARFADQTVNIALPTLSIADVSVVETDGATSVNVTVTLSGPAPAGGVTFDIATADGTAAAGSDYTAQSLTGQTIPAGATSYTFTVQISGDGLDEADETFMVDVTNITGAVAGDIQAVVTIQDDDTAPVVTVGAATASVDEGDDAQIGTLATISDDDGSTLSSVSVSLGGGSGRAYTPGQDVLEAFAAGDADVSFDAATGVLTIAGFAGATLTTADAQATLQTLAYRNTSEDPSATPIRVRIVATDTDTNAGAPTDIAVTVNPVNDAPTLTATGLNPVYAEGAASAALFSDVSISTVEGGQQITRVELNVTGVRPGDTLTGSNGSVALVNGATGMIGGLNAVVSVSMTQAFVLLTPSGSSAATAAFFSSQLNALGFSSTSQNPTGSRTVTLTSTTDTGGAANDGADTSLFAVASTVTLSGVNDAPAIGGPGASAFVENQSPVRIAPAATVSDVDSPDFASGSLTATITNGAASGDALSFVNEGTGPGQISFTPPFFMPVPPPGFSLPGTVSYEGRQIGTWNGGSFGAPLTISFTTADATPTAVQALARAITFANPTDDPTGATRTINFVFNDGDGTANGGSNTAVLFSTVSVSPINDAPVNIVPESITVAEDSPVAITGLAVSDPDGGPDFRTTLSVTNGLLNVATVSGGATVSGSGTSSVTLTGSPAQVNATLSATNGVIYRAAGNFNGSATLTVLTDDGDNPLPPTREPVSTDDTDVDTVAITVTPVNDAPTIASNGSVSATEQTAASITGRLSVTEIDGDTLTVTLTAATGTFSGFAGMNDATISGTGTGTLTITGSRTGVQAVLDGQAAATLTFTDTRDNPEPFAEVAASVSDGSASNSTVQFVELTAVNDAPTANIEDASYAATEGQALNLKNELFVNDVDGTPNVVIPTAQPLLASLLAKAGAGATEEALDQLITDAGPNGIQTVTLAVTEGVLNVTAGGSGAVVTSSGTRSVRIRGTIEQIKALLTTDATSTVSYLNAVGAPSPSATLVLAINDGGNSGTGGAKGASDTATILITAVNSAPTAINGGPFSVAENTATGTALGTVVGVDPDNASASLTYSLQDSAAGRFAIDPATGAITVADGTRLDFEQAASHVITVRATDPGGLFFDRALTIGITDVNPETVTGGAGGDVLYGGTGGDTLYGGAGTDVLYGGFGDDALFGNQQDDVLFGNQNNDALYGGQGNDVLYGGQGDDALFGNLGDDLLQGGVGIDSLSGGAGADVFRYVVAGDSTPAASDTILDFEVNVDDIDLRSVRTGPNDSFVIGASGGFTTVEVDLGGNGTVDMRILLAGQPPITTADILFG